MAFGEMGIGNTTSAAALCHALYGGAAADWVGPGTGVSGDAYAAKVAAVEAGVAANADLLGDPLQVLRALGGHEIAAIAGGIVAARLAGVPVLLDGYTCTAAAAVLHAIDEHAIDHCMVGHLSAEPAHRALCEKLDKVPLLALAMRLGEGLRRRAGDPDRARGACLPHGHGNLRKRRGQRQRRTSRDRVRSPIRPISCSG